MKPSVAKAIIQDVRKRGYVEHNGTFYPPNHAALKDVKPATRKIRATHIKTGWIDDTRNIANKAKHTEPFVILVQQQLGLDVWPEFYFSTERQYRFDFAIPTWSNSTTLKIAVEVQGGIWAKGNSGHSSGTGIMRDMDKTTLASVNGWTIIQRTPSQLLTMETIGLIKKAAEKKLLILNETK